MKKVLLGLILFIIPVMVYAVNGNDIINKFYEIGAGQSVTYNVPVGYDLFLDTSSVLNASGNGVASLVAKDDTTILISADFTEGITSNVAHRVYRDSVIIENQGTNLFSVQYSGFLFKEGSDVTLNWEVYEQKTGTGYTNLFGIEGQNVVMYDDFYDVVFNVLLMLFLVFILFWSILKYVFTKM